jgi:hypothetical protein
VGPSLIKPGRRDGVGIDFEFTERLAARPAGIPDADFPAALGVNIARVDQEPFETRLSQPARHGVHDVPLRDP